MSYVDNQTQNIGEFEKGLGNGVSLNTSNKLSGLKTFEGLEISNIQLSKSGNTSELLATVKNTTNTMKVRKKKYFVHIYKILLFFLLHIFF